MALLHLLSGLYSKNSQILAGEGWSKWVCTSDVWYLLFCEKANVWLFVLVFLPGQDFCKLMGITTWSIYWRVHRQHARASSKKHGLNSPFCWWATSSFLPFLPSLDLFRLFTLCCPLQPFASLTEYYLVLSSPLGLHVHVPDPNPGGLGRCHGPDSCGCRSYVGSSSSNLLHSLPSVCYPGEQLMLLLNVELYVCNVTEKIEVELKGRSYVGF